MNRAQQRLDLVLIALDNFCESYCSATSSPTTDDHSWKSTLSKPTTQLQVGDKHTHTHFMDIIHVNNFFV